MADVALTDSLISKLAREIARGIIPIATLKQTYALDQENFDRLCDTPFFQYRLIEEQAIWSASDPMSIAKRIGAKGATMIEEYLPELYQQMLDPQIPLASKVEALKQISRWAGIGDNPNVKGGLTPEDAKIKITINIGGKQLAFDKEAKLPDRVIEGEVVALTPTTAS